MVKHGQVGTFFRRRVIPRHGGHQFGRAIARRGVGVGVARNGQANGDLPNGPARRVIDRDLERIAVNRRRAIQLGQLGERQILRNERIGKQRGGLAVKGKIAGYIGRGHSQVLPEG